MTVPIIDGIDARTFEYKAIYTQPYRGIWEWGFFYKEYKVTRAEIATWPYQTSPYKYGQTECDFPCITYKGFNY